MATVLGSRRQDRQVDLIRLTRTSRPSGDGMRDKNMDIAYLLFTLMCPLSMVALVGWWAWSMRRSSSASAAQKAPARSATEDNEIVRMRAQLDQLEAHARQEKPPVRG